MGFGEDEVGLYVLMKFIPTNLLYKKDKVIRWRYRSQPGNFVVGHNRYWGDDKVGMVVY